MTRPGNPPHVDGHTLAAAIDRAVGLELAAFRASLGRALDAVAPVDLATHLQWTDRHGWLVDDERRYARTSDTIWPDHYAGRRLAALYLERFEAYKRGAFRPVGFPIMPLGPGV